MNNFITQDAETAPLDMLLKPFSSIGHDWMLITSGDGLARNQWNTMTASWGSLGVLWNKKTCTCFIRPTRHTYSFVEKNDLLTIAFFPSEFKKALQICGSTSGLTTDKAAQANLTPLLLEDGVIGFSEASLILVCKKIYAQDLLPECFIDQNIETFYEKKDYHRMYVNQIVRVYTK